MPTVVRQGGEEGLVDGAALEDVCKSLEFVLRVSLVMLKLLLLLVRGLSAFSRDFGTVLLQDVFGLLQRS